MKTDGLEGCFEVIVKPGCVEDVREALGITRTELAGAAGISRRGLRVISGGKSGGRVETMRAITESLVAEMGVQGYELVVEVRVVEK